MYNEEKVANYTARVIKDFGFNKVEFDKEVDGDYFFNCYDQQGIKDRVRIKSQVGTLFTFIQGQWKSVKGYKI